MKAGRPKKFTREAALEAATAVFRDRGYNGTSVQDLLDAMGINRGSMYNTFGDKQSLFVAAVEHYCTQIRESVSTTLKQEGSPLGNLRAVVAGWRTTALAEPIRGCLATNTAVEVAPHIPEVADTLTYHFSWLERTIRNALDRAVDSGELSHHIDTRALARFLMATDQGLMVLGRAGAAPETIDDMVGAALAVLETTRP